MWNLKTNGLPKYWLRNRLFFIAWKRFISFDPKNNTLSNCSSQSFFMTSTIWNIFNSANSVNMISIKITTFSRYSSTSSDSISMTTHNLFKCLIVSLIFSNCDIPLSSIGTVQQNSKIFFKASASFPYKHIDNSDAYSECKCNDVNCLNGARLLTILSHKAPNKSYE